MEYNYKGILPKGLLIKETYTIMLFIKQGAYAETYRIKGKDGKLYFLKLFNVSKLHSTSFDSNNEILEIELLKIVNHPNLVSYKDSGELIYENKKFSFLILNFIVGETLYERIEREPINSLFEIKQIAIGVLEGLNYLHKLPLQIIHNDITPANIMLDMSTNEFKPIIIDFGYARSFLQSSKSFNKAGLNFYFTASECFVGAYSPQSDFFSVGALMYQLLFGIPPWLTNTSTYKNSHRGQEEIIKEERQKPLAIPNISNKVLDFEGDFVKVLKKALSNDTSLRFTTAEEFINVLKGEIQVEDIINDKIDPSKNDDLKENSPIKKSSSLKRKNGFAAIAGMEELKGKLQNDVIDLLNDKEGAEKYNLSIPNGMLLWGPPGCGKTFFAEKFAEEAGFKYQYIRSSDLASIYVHGSQEKIGNLFKEARDSAPMILCFDELDALVPNREKVNNASQSGEVNEFLSQLNNCGEDGIFVIGTTNNPHSIDPAILRSGRMDIKVYVSPPDLLSRRALFELYLKDMPLDFGIDYDVLATLTEKFVVSDIVLITQEVARVTRKPRERITMQLLKNKISSFQRSVSDGEFEKYKNIKDQLEGKVSNERTPIGFRRQ
jgi:transitional endoplasmic reticulum ATPase